MNQPALFRSLAKGLLLLAAFMGVLLVRPATARAAAKWTEAIVAEGAYEQMDDRLRRVGATDQVNIVVLHSALIMIGFALVLAGLRLPSRRICVNPR